MRINPEIKTRLVRFLRQLHAEDRHARHVTCTEEKIGTPCFCIGGALLEFYRQETGEGHWEEIDENDPVRQFALRGRTYLVSTSYLPAFLTDYLGIAREALAYACRVNLDHEGEPTGIVSLNDDPHYEYTLSQFADAIEAQW